MILVRKPLNFQPKAGFHPINIELYSIVKKLGDIHT